MNTIKRILLVVTVVFGPFKSFGQKNVIDSLINVVATAKQDTTKINAGNVLADKYRRKSQYDLAISTANTALELANKKNYTKGKYKAQLVLGNTYRNKNEYDKALHYYEQALTLLEKSKDKATKSIVYGNTGLCYANKGMYTKAIEYYQLDLKTCEELNDRKAMTYSLNNLGLVYTNLGNYEKSIEYYQRSLKIDEEMKDEQGMSISLNNIGLVHFDHGDFERASEYFFKSLRIKEKIGDKKGVASLYNNIGNIYLRLRQYELSIDYYEKAIVMRNELGDKKGAAISINNVGSIYSEKGEYEKALEYFNQALEIRESMNDKFGLTTCYQNIGNVYLKMKEYDEAIPYYDKALKLQEELNDKKGISGTYFNIANLLYEDKKYDEALPYAEKALEIAKELKAKPEIKNAAQTLALIHYAKGDYKNAYDIYLYHSTIKDSIFSTTANDKLAELKTLYETDKKNAEIALLSKDKELQLIELDKQRILLDRSSKERLLLQQENELKRLTISQSQAALKQKQIEAENQKKANAILQKDKLIQEAIAKENKAKVETQRTILFFISGGAILLLLLAVFIYRGYQQKKKANRIITLQKEKVELQKEMLAEKNREILDSITYAQHLQLAILPPLKDFDQHFSDYFIYYKPKDIVAGDFYFLESTHDNVIFAAADCTGHGVPGAMVSVVCANALNRAVKEFALTDPGEILNKVRDLVIQTFEKSESEVKDGMDISLCVLDKKSRTLKWAGANNPLWLLKQGAEKIHEFTATKQAIGKNEIPEPFKTHEIQLDKGDRIYLFTDGYADQFGGIGNGKRGKKYKYSRLNQFLFGTPAEPMKQVEQLLHNEFEQWRGDLEQIDDVCVIGVKVN